MSTWMQWIKAKVKWILRGTMESSDYVKMLRSLGMRIGERTIVFSPETVVIDKTRPWLIEIGDDVQITRGVIMLTHGYDWSVLKGFYGEVLGSSGKITIGNNVFIGMNTIILKGTTIGNNVIIGAGSLINKNIPDNCVVAGSPVQVICSIEEYYKKRQAAQIAEAQELVREYRKVYHKDPEPQHLSEFFWLFTDDPTQMDKSWIQKMELLGNRPFSEEVLSKHKKVYKDFAHFLSSCS